MTITREFIESAGFKVISCIYIKSADSNYTNLLNDRTKFTWVPSRPAATMAKRTAFGDGILTPRRFLVRCDRNLIGIYETSQPIIEGGNIKLELCYPMDIPYPVTASTSAGKVLTKEELLKLI